MGTRKRVLVLTSTFPRWQGDNEPPFVLGLCRRLADNFDILVLAPHAEGAKRFEQMAGIEIQRFHYFFPRWERLVYQGGILANLKQHLWCYLLLPLFFAAQVIALVRILKRERVDVIHAHWLIPQGFSVVLAGLFVKNMPPLISTSHGGDLMGLNGWLLSLIKRWVIRRSSQMTVVSNTMTSFARALGARPEQLQTISMGVDTTNVFTPDADVTRAENELLFVGRLVEKKGVAYLLEAMPEILRQAPDTHLRLVGDGPMRSALSQQVNRRGIAHAVTFHGAINNSELPGFYRRATVFVAPSIITEQGDQEGLGLVLIEALACKCPVVASDLPAIQEVVISGATGLSVPEKDPSALAKAVTKLLAEPGLRRRLTENGRNHVSLNFDWEIVATRYSRLIEQLGVAQNKSSSAIEKPT
jgi:glycosyltransferase involved in cell wall biosynthesis